MKNSIIALLIALITAMGFSVFKVEGMKRVVDGEDYVFRNGGSLYHFHVDDGKKDTLVKDLEDILILLKDEK